MRLDRRSLRRTPYEGEDGMALVLAVLMLAIMAILTTSVISYTTSNQQSASRTLASQKAFELAEAGLNDALAVLGSKYPSTVYPAGPPDAVPAASQVLATGTTTWSGALAKDASGAWTWTLQASGQVKSPSGSGSVTRNISVQVPVSIPKPEVGAPPIWSWVYSGATGNSCDMTVQQSVQVTAPLYVAGNLCLQNTAKVIQPPSVPGMLQDRLVVGGLLNLQQNANTVGAVSNPLTEAHLLGGCTYAGEPHQTVHRPCITGPKTNVYVTNFDTASNVAPNLVQPDWTDAYVFSSPGPWQRCAAATQAGTPPTFDTASDIASQSTAYPSAFMNDNVPNVFNLVGSPYTCKTDTGELSWNGSTLTVNGTIFIDGSIAISSGSNTVARYNGNGVIYARGTILLKNTNLCAVVSGSACDTANWDPSQRMLILIANGNGGNPAPENQVSAGDSVQFVSASFQGGIYGTNNIDVSTTSQVQGPMISPRIVSPGQSGNLAFPPIVSVPSGTLTQTPPPVQLLRPQHYATG